MSKDLLSHLTKVGKQISLQVTITDSSKAELLLGTMHPQSKESADNKYGVTVDSWGGFNVEKAREIQLELVSEQMKIHNDRLDYLLNGNNLRDIWNDYENSKGE